ncbi:hypothetical protein [Thiorhodospira sibirica]|nr:hypothetical protein [Thiorhodospira sibirica]
MELGKTVVRKLALAVGAMIEGQTPNTVEQKTVLDFFFIVYQNSPL